MADPAEGSVHALTRLTSVSRALTYAISIDEVLEITVDSAAELLDAGRVVLMLRDADGLLRIRASRGIPSDDVERFGEPLDETLVSRLTTLFGPTADRGFLGVPLVVSGHVTGLLAVHRSGSEGATEQEEWLLSALADQAAVALENARSASRRSELETEIQELRRSGSQKEDALHMVGHDLRSPLNSLQGYIHLLRSGTYGPLNEAQENALDRLAAIGGHLASLVENVLEMGRLAAGTLTIEPEPVALTGVVEEAALVVGLSAEAVGVILERDVPVGLGALGDAARVRQVLVQLLDNAIKHSPGGGVVQVTARREPAAGADGKDHVAVRVTDQGPGVPAESAEEIFEPYRQLEDERSAGGIGLGLAIARALVERMGGSLGLEAPSGDGATFVVRLPAAE